MPCALVLAALAMPFENMPTAAVAAAAVFCIAEPYKPTCAPVPVAPPQTPTGCTWLLGESVAMPTIAAACSAPSPFTCVDSNPRVRDTFIAGLGTVLGEA